MREARGSPGRPDRQQVSHAISFIFGAYSSDWLERAPDKREVSGSTPLRPTIEWLRERTQLGM